MSSAFHEPKNLKHVDPRRKLLEQVEVPMGPVRIPRRKNADG